MQDNLVQATLDRAVCVCMGGCVCRRRNRLLLRGSGPIDGARLPFNGMGLECLEYAPEPQNWSRAQGCK